ncbi:MAG: V-type ATP synthase subunit E [Dethiobacteria bacterium]|jgi:V/A-type H+-transporting ATPase subunit E
MQAGAERISRRILDDARAQAEKIVAEAAGKASAILAEAEKEAGKRKEQILERAQKEAEEQKRRILGIAQLDARKEILAAKQELIEETFEQAVARLVNLEEAAYLDYLRQMLLASMKTGEEVIILSPRDKAGIPAKFWKDLGQELAATGRTGKVSLGQEASEIGGGFILQSEGVEINNSFHALLEMQRDELEPEVAALLFKEG